MIVRPTRSGYGCIDLRSGGALALPEHGLADWVERLQRLALTGLPLTCDVMSVHLVLPLPAFSGGRLGPPRKTNNSAVRRQRHGAYLITRRKA